MVFSKIIRSLIVQILFFGTVIHLYSCTHSDQSFDFIAVELEDKNSEKARVIYTPYSNKILHKSDFLFPAYLRVSNEGIFVFDASDNRKTRKYNWSLELENKIGRGEGQGPGEFGNITDFHVSADTLYFSDSTNGFIHVYTASGKFVRSFSFEETIPHRLTSLHNKLVVLPASSERFLFTDLNGNQVGTSDIVTRDEHKYRLISEAVILSDEENIYRLLQYFGLLFKYNHEGSLLSGMKLIDSFQTYFVDTPGSDSQPIMINRNDLEKANLAASLYDNNLCVLIVEIGSVERIIDCYDISDNSYTYSFKPPNSTRDFKIYEDHFIAIHDTSMTVWEWDLESAKINQ